MHHDRDGFKGIEMVLYGYFLCYQRDINPVCNDVSGARDGHGIGVFSFYQRLNSRDQTVRKRDHVQHKAYAYIGSYLFIDMAFL